MPKSPSQRPEGPPTIVNRKARYDYEILNSYEAGIELLGSEVKSILAGNVDLGGAYCRIEDGELWLLDMDIAPYERVSGSPPERKRPRKLLMHRSEIESLRRRSEQRGLTLVPTKLYYRNKRVKVEVSIARGKKQFDKREALRHKTLRREMEMRE